MKKSLLGIVFVFILVGCGKYVEPASSSDTSLLVLKNNKDGKRITNTHVKKIDNQVIDLNKGLVKKVRVSAGRHTINLDSTIYYDGTVKSAESEKITLDFKSSKVYSIDLVPHTLNLIKNNNVTGTYRVFEDEKLILTKDLIFTDRALRSVGVNNSANHTSHMVVDSIIYSAMLSAGI